MEGESLRSVMFFTLTHKPKMSKDYNLGFSKVGTEIPRSNWLIINLTMLGNKTGKIPFYLQA